VPPLRSHSDAAAGGRPVRNHLREFYDGGGFTSSIVSSSSDKFTAAAPFYFLVASLLILIFGAGKSSLDVAAKRPLEHREAKLVESSVAV
jgi:hypothetical protein